MLTASQTMKLSALIGILSFISGGLNVVFANEETAPVFDGQIEGLHLVAKPYDSETLKVPLLRRDFDAKMMKEVSMLLMNLTEDALIKGNSYMKIAFVYTKNFINFVSKMRGEVRKFSEEEFGPPLRKDFTKYMVKLMRKVLQETNQEKEAKQKILTTKQKLSAEQKQEEAKKFVLDLDLFLNVLTKLTGQNPLGLYLAWDELTLDGKPFAEVAHRFANFLRNHASVTLKIGETILSILDH